MSIMVLGAGAFGTALAIALTDGGHDVTLWGRDLSALRRDGENARRLPGVPLPAALGLSEDLADLTSASSVLLAVPAQQLRPFCETHRALLTGRGLVACCKGIDMATGIGPVATLRAAVPDAHHAILTGPSFAADIARGLPTALTLACADEDAGRDMQHALSTPALRLYRSTDTAGAELGGALKNVIAIACGAAIGAGLGDSARAAVMTRGFAEMRRLAPHFRAEQDTLSGLSGLGDLALTCTSDLSRNYRHGRALGQGQPPEQGVTVEGAATAQAVSDLARDAGIDVPITDCVAALARGQIGIDTALARLLNRPLKDE